MLRPNKSAGHAGFGGLGSLMTSNPTMLPTLGLTKYKNMDLQQNQKNPFKVHNRTEKLLVLREREREFHDFNKLEKEGQHVHEKEKTSRPNRHGVIREIRNIKTSKSIGAGAMSGSRA